MSTTWFSWHDFQAGHWNVKPRFRKTSPLMPGNHFVSMGGSLNPRRCAIKCQRGNFVHGWPVHRLAGLIPCIAILYFFWQGSQSLEVNMCKTHQVGNSIAS